MWFNPFTKQAICFPNSPFLFYLKIQVGDKRRFTKLPMLMHRRVFVERERDLNWIGKLGKKLGFLECFGREIKWKMSAQSSFWSSETTKPCPKPSKSPGCCQNFFFSSIGRLNSSSIPTFTPSTTEGLTPWFINCRNVHRRDLIIPRKIAH